MLLHCCDLFDMLVWFVWFGGWLVVGVCLDVFCLGFWFCWLWVCWFAVGFWVWVLGWQLWLFCCFLVLGFEFDVVCGLGLDVFCFWFWWWVYWFVIWFVVVFVWVGVWDLGFVLCFAGFGWVFLGFGWVVVFVYVLGVLDCLFWVLGDYLGVLLASGVGII